MRCGGRLSLQWHSKSRLPAQKELNDLYVRNPNAGDSVSRAKIRKDARNLQSRLEMGMARPESHQPRSSEREAVAHSGCSDLRQLVSLIKFSVVHLASCARLCHQAGGELDQIQFRRRSDTPGASSVFAMRSTITSA